MYNNEYGNSQQASPTGAEPASKKIRFDKDYVKTPAGLLKLVQLACNFIGFICIKVSWGAWISAIFYNILYWCGIIVTALLLAMHTFHFVEKFDSVPWLKVELMYCGVMVTAYIVTSIFATTIGESVGYAVGFFGLLAILAYGYDAFLKYKSWKRGLPPQ